MGSRPPFEKLDFTKFSDVKKRNAEETKDGYTWPAVRTPGHLEMIRSHSSGKLKFSPEQTFDFTAEDLQDLGVIGQGSFGTVNKMLHRKTSTVMAVKRIRCTMDEGEQKNLLKELDVIIKSNNCLYIVQFFGALFTEGDCLICMELMDISLERLYKTVYERLRERLPEEIIGKVAVDTLKALVYLKTLSIIHRDIKPSNILLDRNGHIKLCDFGIAGQLVDSIAKTRDVGCKPYMAPERIVPTNSKGYDVRSDVWSLGITLVEIATGKFPYPPWTSVFDQLQHVVRDDPPLLTPQEHPYFTIDFMNFVNSCLIKDEQHRPKYQKLMESNFIKRYEKEQVDVGAYVRRVLEASPSPTSAGIDGCCVDKKFNNNNIHQ